MSAFGAVVAKGLAGLGGPGAAAAIVAGGLVVGALGGGLVATRGSGSQPASATGKLAVYACPDSGSPLVMIQAGQKLLVTGRTGDNAWLRIHFPEPGRTEAWVQASPLQVAGTVASLPVAECAPELAVAPPSIEPGMSLTAVADNPPSAAPSTPPVATPSPSPSPSAPAPANVRPTLASLTVSTGRISYDTGDYCPNAVKRVTFKVKAGDTAGVASVALFWREPGASSYARAPMTRAAGTAKSGTWQVALDTAANGITKAGKLAYYAVATDTDGATRKVPVEGASTISVAVCVNTGPTITAVSPSSGTSISWNPLGAPGNCQTARDITATIKDGDGVKSATLFYRRPGAASYSQKPMDNTTLRGKWYANLDTLGDKISITSPPTDTLRWYIRAVDATGKSSQLPTRTLVVRRCDTEATFDGVFPTSEIYACTTSATIPIATYANDADQPAGGLRVVFQWTLTNPQTGAAIRGKVTAKPVQPGANRYEGITARFNGKTYFAGQFTVYAVTTDRYGGTTRTPTQGPYTFRCR